MSGIWPVRIVAFGGVSCGTRLWRLDGQPQVTVAAKARFRIKHGSRMAPLVPEPIEPLGEELVPHRPHAEMLFTAARAHSPVPVEAMAVRAALYREAAIMDKGLLVYAPRPSGEVQPFTVAVVAGGGKGTPGALIIDPARPGQRGSLAALSADHPARRALLEHRETPAIAGMIDLPGSFPWSYFQLAPDDQRCDWLVGDEWLILEGLSELTAQLASRLPGAHVEVRAYPPSLKRGSSFAVAMRADQLRVNAVTGCCTLSWRGCFPISDERAAKRLVLVAVLSLEDMVPAWPTRGAIEAALTLPTVPRPSAYAVTAERDDSAPAVVEQARLEQRAREVAALHGAPVVDAATERVEPSHATPDHGALVVDYHGVVSVDDTTLQITEHGTWEMAPDEHEHELAPVDPQRWLSPGAPLGDLMVQPTLLPPSGDEPPQVERADLDRLHQGLADSWDKLDEETQEAVRRVRRP